MRGGIRPPHRRHRQRPVLALPDQPVHRRRALPDDRPRPLGGGHQELQHSARRGPQPLLGVGRPRGVHVPPVQPRLHQQPHDAQALRGGRVRGQGLPSVQQGLLLRDRDPQEDGHRGGLEVAGAGCHRPRDGLHRRGRKAEGHLRRSGKCPSPRPRRWWMS